MFPTVTPRPVVLQRSRTHRDRCGQHIRVRTRPQVLEFTLSSPPDPQTKVQKKMTPDDHRGSFT